MAAIDRAFARWRRRLLDQEADVVREIADAYAVAERAIAKALLDVLESMAEAGQSSPSALLLESRLETLLQTVERELVQWGGLSGRYIESGQSTAVAQAALASQQYAEALAPRTLSVAGSWNRLPIEALQRWVGSRGDGSPLTGSLERFGALGSRIVEEGITRGLALGQNPREIGRRISRALREEDAMPPGFDESFEGLRSLRYTATVTARTEFLRAHRGAALDNYRANADVVKGFMSRSARDRRTCLACLMADGQVYPLGYEATSWHPQCRCAWIPVLDEAGAQATGPELFLLQSDDVKLAVLGPARFELLEQGKDPRSFVVIEDDRQWGPQRRIIPVGQIADGSSRNRPDRPAPKGSPPPTRDTPIFRPSANDAAADFLDIDPETNQEQFERVIRGYNRECVAGFDSEGVMRVAPIVGEDGSVAINPQSFLSLPGLTLVHNHPRSGWFSQEDFFACSELNLRTIVAVLPNMTRIELSRVGDSWPEKMEEIVRMETKRARSKPGNSLQINRRFAKGIKSAFSARFGDMVRISERIMDV